MSDRHPADPPDSLEQIELTCPMCQGTVKAMVNLAGETVYIGVEARLPQIELYRLCHELIAERNNVMARGFELGLQMAGLRQVVKNYVRVLFGWRWR